MSNAIIDEESQEDSSLSFGSTSSGEFVNTKRNLQNQVPYGRRRSCWKKNANSVAARPTCKNVGEAGIITCGICGVQRYYKFIKQTKKYGLHSCEPCRKFITGMIQNVNNKQHVLFTCNRKGSQNCLISDGVLGRRGPANSKKDAAANGRCKACWLTLCLKKYKMPVNLRNNLAQFLAEDEKQDLFTTLNTEMLHSEIEVVDPIQHEVSKYSDGNSCLKVLCQNYLSKMGLKVNSNDSKRIVILRIKR